MNLSTASRNSRDYDTIGPDQLDDWIRNLLDLSKKTIVYPSPDQMLLRGSKLHLIEQLREIARKVTFTDYPEVVLIPNPEDATLTCRPGLFVKRSFSDQGAHVLRPCEKNSSNLMSDLVTDTRKFYDHDSIKKLNVKPVWFGMAFIPEMSQKGEIKAFFIGGRLTHIISTVPSGHKLKIHQVFEITPLSHLLSVPFFFLALNLFTSSPAFPQENKRIQTCNGKAFDRKAT